MLSVAQLSVKVDNHILLDAISLSVPKTDYLCIIGQNGAGKSTLLKALMGIVPITSGDVKLGEHAFEQLNQKALARSVSYVGQSMPVVDMTVADFIRLGRYVHRDAFTVWSHADQLAFDDAVASTAVATFLSRHCAQLSGGEYQRVQIAAALCQQAPLLLLDEPTSFLDPHHQVEVHHLIQRLNQTQQITIIEVTHDINHAVQHSQHILALKSGGVLWYGAASELLLSPILPEIYDQEFVTVSHPETGQLIALTTEQGS